MNSTLLLCLVWFRNSRVEHGHIYSRSFDSDGHAWRMPNKLSHTALARQLWNIDIMPKRKQAFSGGGTVFSHVNLYSNDNAIILFVNLWPRSWKTRGTVTIVRKRRIATERLWKISIKSLDQLKFNHPDSRHERLSTTLKFKTSSTVPQILIFQLE